jgi:DNA-binding IclR family transcriptional regulator
VPRLSPPTERVAAILRLLAESDSPLTLSEIARRLELNVATCQTILESLAANGFVLRAPSTKAFTLGPSLVSIGEAARRAASRYGRAGELVDRLADDIDFGCSLVGLTGHQLTVLHRAGRPDQFPVPGMVEGPFPFVPPFGAGIVACSDDDVRARWMEQGADFSDDAPGRMMAVLDTIRRRGWCVWAYGPSTEASLHHFEAILAALGRDTKSTASLQDFVRLWAYSGTSAYLDDELDRLTDLAVTTIAAPTELPGVPLEIHVHVYRTSISRQEVERLARRILETCVLIRTLGDAGDQQNGRARA